MSLHQNVKKLTLPNGLTFLYEVNKAAPVISLNIGVRVGSALEKPNEAGLSHLLEHMVFKGSLSYGPGEIATIVEESGGELNAYTSFDQTVYYINLAANHYKKGLHLLKEMVFDSLIDPIELERETEVVLEELKRGLDNPHRVLHQLLFGLAFQKHPYGRPVIGFEKTIKSFTPAIVKKFYQKWYVPNNMVLAVCGDFNEKELIKTVKNYFGKTKKKPIPRMRLPVEKVPTQPRAQTKAYPFQGNYLALSFPIPHFQHEDIPALDVLSFLLGNGETSRLEQIVKQQKRLATSIHSYAYTPNDPGVFLIEAMLTADNSSKLLPAILEEIEFCKTKLFDNDDIERVKISMRSSLYYEKETCEGSARKALIYEIIANDHTYDAKYLEAINNITATDILRVAVKYLNLKSSSTVFLHAPDTTKPLLKLKSKNQKSAAPKFKQQRSQDGIKQFRLQNGITVLTKENPRLPLVSLYQACLGGLRYETSKDNGITHLMTGLLEKGTTSKTALDIAKITENMAGSIEGYSGKNSWGLASSFLSEKTATGLDLFCDLLTNPLFDNDEFKKEKYLTLEAIRNQEDSLSTLAYQKFQALLFKGHPYSLPLLGTAKTVGSLKLKHMSAQYQKLLDPRNMIISLAGDIVSEEVVAFLQERLGHMKTPDTKAPKLKTIKPLTSIQKVEGKKDRKQAHVVLGFLGTTLYHQDRYGLEVLNSILSGQGGRLFLELRDKMSLCYTVSPALVLGMEKGFFSAYIGTDPQKLDQSIAAILKEFKKIQTHKISQAELKRAQNYIIGNYTLDLQRNSAIAQSITFNSLYRSDLAELKDYPKRIMKVTANDILKLAQKYLTLDAYCLSIIKP